MEKLCFVVTFSFRLASYVSVCSVSARSGHERHIGLTSSVKIAHTVAPHPGRTSPAGERLAILLQECVQTLPGNFSMYPRRTLYQEHPQTTSGKYIRCLAQRQETRSIAVLFYGRAGPNGVFCAATGLIARAAARALKGASADAHVRLVTAEANQLACSTGRSFLRRQRLDNFVDLRCEYVCERSESCAAEIERVFCPVRPLSLLIVDFMLEQDSLFFQTAINVCAPRVVFVENSGLRWWLFPGMRARLKPDGERSQELWPWHQFEENFHQQSSVGQGAYRLVVNRHLSGLDVRSEPLDEDPLRRFSIYIAAKEP
eukprot:TRINITY_DN14231_c0_g1_i1.p1 TRINITY_DN14231_c0_g1~~TRINITY_DN14231_c0_g1_i1.p1  ORF type:complete len:315 (-),score=15.85 TRINITY_DN14231_c0_g1_i1:111-1055(-)